MSLQKAAFFLAIFLCLTPWASPPAALALGILLAFTIGNPYTKGSARAAKLLLQVSVVLLGFGMNITAVYNAGKDGILFTVATIFGTLILGYFVGKMLSVKRKTSDLVSAGTAICGGSAIAAVAPAIDADAEEISVSLGTVFVLNSVALILFPLIGTALGMTQGQFGIWAAVAIHDTSSVVGAAQVFGEEALAVATTVKLARALWIAPVALLFAFLYRKSDSHGKARLAIPWFIFLFLLAAVVRSYAPPQLPPSLFDSLVNLAKAGMTVTLFLIGTNLSRSSLRAVGPRPLLQGIILWLVISVVALIAVMYAA